MVWSIDIAPADNGTLDEQFPNGPDWDGLVRFLRVDHPDESSDRVSNV
jgi:hypothetical protein